MTNLAFNVQWKTSSFSSVGITITKNVFYHYKNVWNAPFLKDANDIEKCYGNAVHI